MVAVAAHARWCLASEVAGHPCECSCPDCGAQFGGLAGCAVGGCGRCCDCCGVAGSLGPRCGASCCANGYRGHRRTVAARTVAARPGADQGVLL